MSDYLMHYGIKDQKWYRRRFQNKDGSLTPAGKRRYGEWNPGKKKNVGLKELKNVDGSKRYAIESEDGIKVGNISTYHQSDDSLRVSWIGVENKFKRDGYASSAMEKLKEDAIKNGYKKMSVVIPKDKADIQHIYERLGFKSSNANLTLDEFQDSITTLGDVVKMELDLTHSDELMHYGVSKDNGAPGRGSGRYPKGSGKRPFQREGKEKRVFVSGSSKTQFDDNPYYRKELPKPIRDELDKFVKESAGIIVGDAPGIDRQVQNYLKSLNYQNVTVYGPGKQVRYNANPKWATRPIDAPEFEEGSKEWLAKKDIAMTNDSTEGLAVILDEGAKATRKNVARMKEQGKEVKVYELSKEAQEFDHWVDELLDEATHSDAPDEELYHYGVGHLHGGHSGRYPWGSRKDSKQSQKAALNSSNKLIDASLNSAPTKDIKKIIDRDSQSKNREERENILNILDKRNKGIKATDEDLNAIDKAWHTPIWKNRSKPGYVEHWDKVAALGLKALQKMENNVEGDAWYDPSDKSSREWFLYEDQTIGKPAIADLIIRGYSANDCFDLVRIIEENSFDASGDPSDFYDKSSAAFEVSEGNWMGADLGLFAEYCEKVKNSVEHSDLLEDFLQHYGVGPDDNPPGRGSGRYAKGTGKDPYQHDPVMKKKMGLFDRIGQRLKKKYDEYAHDYEKKQYSVKHPQAAAWNDYLDKRFEETYSRGVEIQNRLSSKQTTKEEDKKLLAEGEKIWTDFTNDYNEEWKKYRANKTRKEALAKAREVRKANKEKAAAEKVERDKHEAEKQSAIASGDPEKISKFLSEMSNQEQRDAITRISQMKTLNDSARAQADARAKAEAELAEKNRPRTKAEIRQERIDNLLSSISSSANKIDKLRDAGEKFIKAYNLAAAVNNSLNPDKKLKKIDFGNNEKKDDKKDK